MSNTPPNTRFVNTHFRAMLAVGMLLTCAVLDLLLLILFLLRLLRMGPYSATAADLSYLEGEINPGEFVSGLVGLAQIVVFVATAVAFLVWLHRAYKNLRAFGVKTETSPGWAVGYWFIPFANLVRPYQVVKELWIKSDPAVDFTHGFAKRLDGARDATLVGVWWFFWIAGGVIGRFYSRLNDSEIPAASEHVTIWMGEARSILMIAAAALAAWIVWTNDRMQSEKSQRLGLNMWSAPPPPPASFDTVHGDFQT